VDPETVGGLFLLALTGLGCVACAVRALGAAPRSRRLAGLALACGLTVFPALCLLAAHGAGGGAAVAVGAGVVVSELAAVILGVMSLAAGKADGGTSRATPVAAMLLGVVGGFLGLATAAFPFVLAVGGPDAETQWTYRVDPPGFEITLPSGAWQKADEKHGVARFGCPQPAMVAGVKDVRPATTASEFEAAVTDMKRVRDRNPLPALVETRGPNANGHEHWLFVGEENGPDGRFTVALSVTWWNRTHAVFMLFEGQHRMRSQTGRNREAEVFRAAAPSILSSVK
jgi:hypothetical protein